MNCTVESYIKLPDFVCNDVKHFITITNKRNRRQTDYYLSNNFNYYPTMPSFMIIKNDENHIEGFLSIYADNIEEAEISVCLDESKDNCNKLNLFYEHVKEIFIEFNYHKVLIKLNSDSTLKDIILPRIDCKIDHSELMMELTTSSSELIQINYDYIIRLASEEDAASLALLQSSVFETPLDTSLSYVNESLANPTLSIYVIINPETNDVLACSMLSRENDSFHLFGLVVDKRQQHKGIGTILLTYIINETNKINIKKLTLAVDSSNKNAISLYDKVGFKVTETIDYYSFKM